MRVFLTVCTATKVAMEDDGAFFLRADAARDKLIELAKATTRDTVSVTSFLKIKDGAAHVEFDLKGLKRHLGTFSNIVIMNAHGDAEPVPALPGGRVPPPPAQARAIETVVDD